MTLAFISYRRDDTAVAASRLAEALRNRYGFEAIFYDRELPAGTRFEARIEEALRSAEVVLALVGSGFLGKSRDGTSRLADGEDWVRRELDLALESSAELVPVLVDDVRWKDFEGQLPPSLLELPGHNSLELKQAYGFEHGLRDVIQRIDSVLDARSHGLLERGTLSELNRLDESERQSLCGILQRRLATGESNEKLLHRVALCLLYPPPAWSDAQSHLEQALELSRNSTYIVYYLALSMMRGERPRRLRMRVARRAVELLDGVDAEDLPAQFHALAFLIKRDYFASHGLAGSDGLSASQHLDAYAVAVTRDEYDLDYLMASLKALPVAYFHELGMPAPR